MNPQTCSTSRREFVAALAEWMLEPNSDEKGGPPEMTEFGVCRSCAMDIFCQIAEANLAYSQDMQAIVHATQDAVEELGQEVQELKGEVEKRAFKH